MTPVIWWSTPAPPVACTRRPIVWFVIAEFQCSPGVRLELRYGASPSEPRRPGGALLPVLPPRSGGQRLPGRCRVGVSGRAYYPADRRRPPAPGGPHLRLDRFRNFRTHGDSFHDRL